jgi:hypothetical protein
MNPAYYHSVHGYYSKWDVQDPEWVDIGSREDELSRSRLAKRPFFTLQAESAVPLPVADTSFRGIQSLHWEEPAAQHVALP